MSDSVASLRHKITNTQDLQSVVSTMKAMAASSIGQYEAAVHSLDDYESTVQLGLAACFRQRQSLDMIVQQRQKQAAMGVIVFGSDQGLVGHFNEVMAEYVVDSLAKLPGKKTVWAVGERIQSRLADTGLLPTQSFKLPASINAIPTLVGQVLKAMEQQRTIGAIDSVSIFHHQPQTGSIYTPVLQQLLPLDDTWLKAINSLYWPTNNLPEVIGDVEHTLRALVREYLFVGLFKACAESLASENASRLMAMQRAEKNIDELQQALQRSFHSLRQAKIDEELFDVLAGFAALN